MKKNSSFINLVNRTANRYKYFESPVKIPQNELDLVRLHAKFRAGDETIDFGNGRLVKFEVK